MGSSGGALGGGDQRIVTNLRNLFGSCVTNAEERGKNGRPKKTLHKFLKKKQLMDPTPAFMRIPNKIQIIPLN